MQQINVVNIMNTIKEEIKEENISVADQNLATPYYKRRMLEYHEQKNLVIFGAGRFGKMLYRMLDMEGLSDKVACFCDNNPLMQNTTYKELCVVSPLEAYRKYPEAMFIITPRYFENEILRELVVIGLDVNKISIFVMAQTGLED